MTHSDFSNFRAPSSVVFIELKKGDVGCFLTYLISISTFMYTFITFREKEKNFSKHLGKRTDLQGENVIIRL